MVSIDVPYLFQGTISRKIKAKWVPARYRSTESHAASWIRLVTSSSIEPRALFNGRTGLITVQFFFDRSKALRVFKMP